MSCMAYKACARIAWEALEAVYWMAIRFTLNEQPVWDGGTFWFHPRGYLKSTFTRNTSDRRILSTQPNKDIEPARVAVGANHFAYATAKIKKTVKKGTKTKPDTITLDVKGFLWDLRLGKDNAAVSPGVSTLDSWRAKLLALGVTITRGVSTNKSKPQIDGVATTYIAGHSKFDAKTNNRKTFSDHMKNST
ncbi:hypothetical protein RB594_001060 [Gaeumannomyces avenae]